MMNLVDGKKYPLHDFANRYSYDNDHLTLKSLNNSSFITEAQLKETAFTIEIRFSFSSDNVEDHKLFFKVSDFTFQTNTVNSTKRFSFVSKRYKGSDLSKVQAYAFLYNLSRIQPNLRTFALHKNSILDQAKVTINGSEIYPPDGIWQDSSYSEASDFVEPFDMQFNSLPNGIDVYIYSIRIYNRDLSSNEILANAQLDNSRFNN